MGYTYHIKIHQNGELKKEFINATRDSEAFGWLLRNQGQSVDWALRHGEWVVEEINEQTGEVEFWKPYSRP